MTSSCASACAVRVGASVALAVAVVVSAAGAQERKTLEPGAPVVLAPPGDSTAGSEPAPRAKPAQSAPDAQAPAEAAPGGGVKVDPLDAVDPDSAGVLDSKSGGLGVEMWAGTMAPVAYRLLTGPGRQPVLPTARGLLERLLLTAARPPQGGSEAGAEPSLIARRVDRLLAMGAVSAAHRLLETVPAQVEEEAIALARMNTAFLMNDNASACGEASARVQSFQGDPWRKAVVFCQYLAGKESRAAIGAGLLREQGIEDKAFFTLVDIMGGNQNATFTPPDDLTPLHIAMMRTARVPIPETMVETSGAAALRAIAFSPNASLDIRLDSAERAEALGSLEPSELRQIYGAVDFAPGDVSQALSAVDGQRGPRGRALLYHAARAQQVPAARAEILAKALGLAHAQGRTETAVRVFVPLIDSVPPSDDLDWFATLAGRALYFAGHYDKARAWAALADRRPYNEPGPRAAGRGAGASDGGTAGPRLAGALPSDLALWPLRVLAAGAPPEAPAEDNAAGAERARSGAVITLTTQGKSTIETQRLAPIRSEGESEFDSAMFSRWRKAEAAWDPVAAARRAALLLALLDGLGTEVPQEAWLESTGPGREPVTLPAYGLLAALAPAAGAGRVAETVLLAMAILGDSGDDRLHPVVIGPVVRALVTLGFEKEARALAVEAAFKAGL